MIRNISEAHLATNGRHPVWILLLLGLLLGQIITLLDLTFGFSAVTGFSAVIPGWQAFLYNATGAVSCILILVGISLQKGTSTVKRFVSALLIEQYASFLLSMTCLTYGIHTLLKPGNTFPFILFCLGFGVLLRGWQIRKELKDVQFDLAVASRIKEARIEETLNGRK